MEEKKIVKNLDSNKYMDRKLKNQKIQQDFLKKAWLLFLVFLSIKDYWRSRIKSINYNLLYIPLLPVFGYLLDSGKLPVSYLRWNDYFASTLPGLKVIPYNYNQTTWKTFNYTNQFKKINWSYLEKIYFVEDSIVFAFHPSLEIYKKQSYLGIYSVDNHFYHKGKTFLLCNSKGKLLTPSSVTSISTPDNPLSLVSKAKESSIAKEEAKTKSSVLNDRFETQEQKTFINKRSFFLTGRHFHSFFRHSPELKNTWLHNSNPKKSLFKKLSYWHTSFEEFDDIPTKLNAVFFPSSNIYLKHFLNPESVREGSFSDYLQKLKKVSDLSSFNQKLESSDIPLSIDPFSSETNSSQMTTSSEQGTLSLVSKPLAAKPKVSTKLKEDEVNSMSLKKDHDFSSQKIGRTSENENGLSLLEKRILGGFAESESRLLFGFHSSELNEASKLKELNVSDEMLLTQEQPDQFEQKKDVFDQLNAIKKIQAVNLEPLNQLSHFHLEKLQKNAPFPLTFLEYPEMESRLEKQTRYFDYSFYNQMEPALGNSRGLAYKIHNATELIRQFIDFQLFNSSLIDKSELTFENFLNQFETKMSGSTFNADRYKNKFETEWDKGEYWQAFLRMDLKKAYKKNPAEFSQIRSPGFEKSDSIDDDVLFYHNALRYEKKQSLFLSHFSKHFMGFLINDFLHDYPNLPKIALGFNYETFESPLLNDTKNNVSQTKTVDINAERSKYRFDKTFGNKMDLQRLMRIKAEIKTSLSPFIQRKVSGYLYPDSSRFILKDRFKKVQRQSLNFKKWAQESKGPSYIEIKGPRFDMLTKFQQWINVENKHLINAILTLNKPTFNLKDQAHDLTFFATSKPDRFSHFKRRMEKPTLEAKKRVTKRGQVKTVMKTVFNKQTTLVGKIQPTIIEDEKKCDSKRPYLFQYLDKVWKIENTPYFSSKNHPIQKLTPWQKGSEAKVDTKFEVKSNEFHHELQSNLNPFYLNPYNEQNKAIYESMIDPKQFKVRREYAPILEQNDIQSSKKELFKSYSAFTVVLSEYVMLNNWLVFSQILAFLIFLYVLRYYVLKYEESAILTVENFFYDFDLKDLLREKPSIQPLILSKESGFKNMVGVDHLLYEFKPVVLRLKNAKKRFSDIKISHPDFYALQAHYDQTFLFLNEILQKQNGLGFIMQKKPFILNDLALQNQKTILTKTQSLLQKDDLGLSRSAYLTLSKNVVSSILTLNVDTKTSIRKTAFAFDTNLKPSLKNGTFKRINVDNKMKPKTKLNPFQSVDLFLSSFSLPILPFVPKIEQDLEKQKRDRWYPNEQTVEELKQRQKIKAEGLQRGFLLIGPPGTGKTLLVKSLAGEAEVPVILESSSRLAALEKKSAEEKVSDHMKGVIQLKKVFRLAKKYSPSILFLDEVDTIGQNRKDVLTYEGRPKRKGASKIFDSIYLDNPDSTLVPKAKNRLSKKKTNKQDHFKTDQNQINNETTNISPNHIAVEPSMFEPNDWTVYNPAAIPKKYRSLTPPQTNDFGKKPHRAAALSLLTQLLCEIDGLKNRTDVIIIGATNRPHTLDPALLRPGRLGKIIYLDLPDKQKRFDLLTFDSKKHDKEELINWNFFANQTMGFSAAHLSSAMNLSALRTIYKTSFLKKTNQFYTRSSKSLQKSLGSNDFSVFKLLPAPVTFTASSKTENQQVYKNQQTVLPTPQKQTPKNQRRFINGPLGTVIQKTKSTVKAVTLGFKNKKIPFIKNNLWVASLNLPLFGKAKSKSLHTFQSVEYGIETIKSNYSFQDTTHPDKGSLVSKRIYQKAYDTNASFIGKSEYLNRAELCIFKETLSSYKNANLLIPKYKDNCVNLFGFNDLSSSFFTDQYEKMKNKSVKTFREQQKSNKRPKEHIEGRKKFLAKHLKYIRTLQILSNKNNTKVAPEMVAYADFNFVVKHLIKYHLFGCQMLINSTCALQNPLMFSLNAFQFHEHLFYDSISTFSKKQSKKSKRKTKNMSQQQDEDIQTFLFQKEHLIKYKLLFSEYSAEHGMPISQVEQKEKSKRGYGLLSSIKTKKKKINQELFADPHCINRLAYYLGGKAFVSSLLKESLDFPTLSLWSTFHTLGNSQLSTEKDIERLNKQLVTKTRFENYVLMMISGKASECLLLKNEGSSDYSTLGRDELQKTGSLMRVMIEKNKFYQAFELTCLNELTTLTLKQSNKASIDRKRSYLITSIDTNQSLVDYENIHSNPLNEHTLSQQNSWKQVDYWWQIQLDGPPTQVSKKYSDWTETFNLQKKDVGRMIDVPNPNTSDSYFSNLVNYLVWYHSYLTKHKDDPDILDFYEIKEHDEANKIDKITETTQRTETIKTAQINTTEQTEKTEESGPMETKETDEIDEVAKTTQADTTPETVEISDIPETQAFIEDVVLSSRSSYLTFSKNVVLSEEINKKSKSRSSYLTFSKNVVSSEEINKESKQDEKSSDTKKKLSKEQIYYQEMKKNKLIYASFEAWSRINGDSELATSTTLLNKRLLKDLLPNSELTWNSFQLNKMDWIHAHLLFQSFDKSFSILETNRELLDLFVHRLLCHERLYPFELKEISDAFFSKY